MKTPEQWLAEAKAEMALATWTPLRWASTIDDTENYKWENTHNYKASVALWNALHPPAPPPVPVITVDPRSQFVVFCAEQMQVALAAPMKYALSLSADKEYRYPTEKVPELDLHHIITTMKNQGHRVPGWCDCRPAPDGTPAAVGVEFVKQYGLDYFIGQAESEDEFEDAVSVSAKVIVGNITSLNADQLKQIKVDRISFIQEDYWNEGWARAESDLIAAYCAGTYPTGLWYPRVNNYRSAGRWRMGDGLYYAKPDTDYENLP